MDKFIVCGYYTDNMQPWFESVDAPDARTAIAYAVHDFGMIGLMVIGAINVDSEREESCLEVATPASEFLK